MPSYCRFRESFGYIEQIANGESFEMAENNYQGEYKHLLDNLGRVRETIYEIAYAIGRAGKHVEEGDLLYREDPSKLRGAYAEMVSSLNGAIDILVTFIDKAQDYMEQIGQGNIPEKITEEYHGDFDKNQAEHQRLH